MPPKYNMDYSKIYENIIKQAKTHNYNCYTEQHHILPKSLGGSDVETNLVKLTAREHFICHWLLVKMYKKGSVERRKMLFAFWRMGSSNNGKRYINARAYEKLRLEFSNTVSKMNQHFGVENSQYGKHWYTDLRTGESKSFYEKPNEFWIEGRNWFKKAKFEIYSIKTRQKVFNKRGTLKLDKIELEEKKKNETFNFWNEFLNSDFDSINEFNKSKCPSLNLHGLFRKYIPEYMNHKSGLTKFIKCPLV